MQDYYNERNELFEFHIKAFLSIALAYITNLYPSLYEKVSANFVKEL